jgi:E3 ubiquitin-protein ligase DOA10
VSEHYTTSEPTCPICREDFKEHDNVIRLQCNPSVGHEYHKECISVWARTSCQNRCPMCRAPFDMVTI